MNKFKQRLKDDPEFALMCAAITIPLAIGLINATAKIIGSSAYAVHAAKRK